MFAYTPERLSPMAPLVVALHGCTQTAEEYDNGTGWSSLADNLGVAIIYPQQQPTKNPKSCFSWFLTDDITRGNGEAFSIRRMIEHAIALFGSDRRKVFVTGLSAGGAMASVMLATYPEIFAGGAIIAGLPYGCASNVQQAFEAMFTEQDRPAKTLGDRVRAASSYQGPWPKVSIWHGTDDPIVKPSNGEDIIRQWINVHGISEPPFEQLIGPHSRRIWNDASGNALIEAFSISGMGHGVPLATTASRDGYGMPGAFFLNVGISSTDHIARFWGLNEWSLEAGLAADAVVAPVQASTEGRAFVLSGAHSEQSLDGEEKRDSTAFDPNDVIARAFKAAGLPIPKMPPDAAARTAPGPIIAAAFKAAGLLR
ncbi:MAG TPA: PHB depolymerase family esterase [Xanthobacteraceae bacterium]|jgi:poly(hydroxyalkanoate) depolymerase family esterase|nr:PHB depolymerase family esterase [Xanthobacteraceae bacterium]